MLSHISVIILRLRASGCADFYCTIKHCVPSIMIVPDLVEIEGFNLIYVNYFGENWKTTIFTVRFFTEWVYGLSFI